MHDLHEHLTQSLAERLKKRRVVTWYDPRREFTAFIAELAGGTAPEKCQVDSVEVLSKSTSLCVMQESFFEVKFAAETCVAGDVPDPLLIYIPGKDRHDDSAILMELGTAAETRGPQSPDETRRRPNQSSGEIIAGESPQCAHSSRHDSQNPAGKKLTCSLKDQASMNLTPFQ